MSSPLAPLHFRNQLALRYDLFAEFCRLVSETWPGVMVKELIGHNGLLGDELYLEVRNEDFVGEVGLMGHGLQMWLQTMWFLTLARNSDTVILDEPDVYMHPDLQRRIIRFLRNRHPQCIITTHSVEILSEVDAEQILVIDRRRRSSSFASTIPAVQRLLDRIGSVHNIQVTRLWQARRFLMVEGKDVTLLKALQNILYPRSPGPIDAIPSMQIGGWGGWHYAVGSLMLLRNAMGEAITPYCILDSDYHTVEEIEERQREAREKNVQLHIWTAKELENYLLSPKIIHRAVMQSLPSSVLPPSEEEVRDRLVRIVNGFRESVLDGLATEIQLQQRGLALSTARSRARARLNDISRTGGGLVRRAPRKEVISKLAAWSQEKFRVPLNPLKLARAARRDEVDEEVRTVLFAIEAAEAFPD